MGGPLSGGLPEAEPEEEMAGGESVYKHRLVKEGRGEERGRGASLRRQWPGSVAEWSRVSRCRIMSKESSRSVVVHLRWT